MYVLTLRVLCTENNLHDKCTIMFIVVSTYRANSTTHIKRLYVYSIRVSVWIQTYLKKTKRKAVNGGKFLS